MPFYSSAATLDSRLIAGQDVLSEADPLVFWNDHSWLTDKGSYSASGNLFTPKEGVFVTEEYVQRIHADVRNKINLSRVIEEHDYYRLLFGDKD